MGRRLMVSLCATVWALAALVGCGGSSGGGGKSTGTAAPTPSQFALPSCIAKGVGTPVHLSDTAGTQTDGVIMGSGHKGVVLAHQSDDTPCSLLALARRLVRSGYRVALFVETAPVPEITAWAGALRARGATSVVLVGASIGAAGSLVAAASIRPPVDAVVSLSSEDTLDTTSVTAAVRKLRMPVMFVGSDNDLSANSGGAVTRGLYDDCPCPGKKLVVLHGVNHGIDILTLDVRAAAVQQQVLAFIAANTA